MFECLVLHLAILGLKVLCLLSLVGLVLIHVVSAVGNHCVPLGLPL